MTQAQIQKLVDKMQALPKADLKVVVDTIKDLVEKNTIWVPTEEEKILIEEGLKSKPVSSRSIKEIFRKYRTS